MSNPKPDPLTVRLLTRGALVANVVIAYFAYDTGHMTDFMFWGIAATACAVAVVWTERNWYKDVRAVR